MIRNDAHLLGGFAPGKIGHQMINTIVSCWLSQGFVVGQSPFPAKNMVKRRG